MAAKWYRKLPLTIRAEKFDCTEIRPGDYVVYGLYGETYVAKGVTFEQTHVEVS
jgi:hypothetical protein